MMMVTGRVQRGIDDLLADRGEWTARELAAALYGPNPIEHQIGAVRRALRTLQKRGHVAPGTNRTGVTYIRSYPTADN